MATNPSSKHLGVSISVTWKKMCAYKKNHPNATQEEICALGLEDSVEIGQMTSSDILHGAEKWLSTEDLNSTKESKGHFTQLEASLWTRFGNISSQSLAISDDMLWMKANEFGESLGVAGLSYSTGWLQGFKKCHGIKMPVIHGESASVEADIVEEERRKLRKTLCGYSRDCIYNIDETGLFFHLEPNKTLATGAVSGTKKCEQPITVALCCNADEADKTQPLVIAKPASPRCLPKTFNVQTVKQYYPNAKAWMTAAIFTEWLKGLEWKMAAKQRHIFSCILSTKSYLSH